MTLNLSIVELIVLFFCAVTLGIVIHFFITSRRSLKSPSSIESEKNKQTVDEWKLKYFNEIEKRDKDVEEMQSLLAEAQESSQIYKEQIEELRRQQKRTQSELESTQKATVTE